MPCIPHTLYCQGKNYAILTKNEAIFNKIQRKVQKYLMLYQKVPYIVDTLYWQIWKCPKLHDTLYCQEKKWQHRAFCWQQRVLSSLEMLVLFYDYDYYAEIMTQSKYRHPST